MFTVDQSSWHYNMAYRHHVKYKSDMPKDFCTYWRCVIAGTTKFITLTTFIGVVAIGNIMGILLMFVGGWNDAAIPAAINLLTGGVILALLCILVSDYIGNKYAEYRINRINKSKNPSKPKPPNTNFIGTWYKTLVDKTCIPVEYVTTTDILKK